MNVRRIGENAGIVWRTLNGENRKWEYEELKQATGLSGSDLNAAIGWLAREGKIQFEEHGSRENDLYYIELNYYIG